MPAWRAHPTGFVPTWTDEDVSTAVAASRAAQGLPHHIEDPVALARIARLTGRDLDHGTVKRDVGR